MSIVALDNRFKVWTNGLKEVRVMQKLRVMGYNNIKLRQNQFHRIGLNQEKIKEILQII